MYLGFTMLYETAEELLATGTGDTSLTGPIQLHGADKGICIFGIQLDVCNDVWRRGHTLSQSLALILKAKADFEADIERMGICLQNLRIDYMESGYEIREIAEPTLIEWS